MNIKIELNESQSSSLKAAAQRHVESGAGETLDEAFNRLSQLKSLNDREREKLRKVKRALEDGLVTREKSGTKLSKAEALRLYQTVEDEERRQILRNMRDNISDNYLLVTTEAQLNDAVETLKRESTIVFDVETTGVDVWSDEIVGHVLSAVEADKHYYIPTRHITTEKHLSHELVTARLKSVYEDEGTLKIAHNATFDINMLFNDAIEIAGELWDTQEAMKLLNENLDTYALKPLVSKFLNIPSLKYEQLFGNAGFNEVSDLTLATAYAAKDGDITYKLYEFQRKQLSERFPTIYKYAKEVEMPLIKVVAEMERNGFVIDFDYAKKYGQQLENDMSEKERSIKRVLGDINLNSPAQLKEALEKHIGRRLESTDAKKVLKPLAEQYVIIAELLEYKAMTKLYGTYVSKLPDLVSEKTGRLMGNFFQNGTVTGRFSSKGNFNAQNQPYEARKLFVAPPGKVLISADFKAQEIRAVAYLSQEPVLIEAFKNGVDAYASLAAKVFNRPYEEVYKNADGSDTKERKQMKVVWLATLYGMSSASLANMLKTGKKSAEKLQNDLFESMPALSKWIEDTQNFVKKTGFVWMDGMQRKRRLPEATLKKREIPFGQYYDEKYKEDRLFNSSINKALRQGPNAVVQGSSAIQTKVTMIKLAEECKKRKDWKLCATVHDELILEVPENFTREDARVIEDIMINSYLWGDNVKNGTDLEVMKRWGEGVTINDWF